MVEYNPFSEEVMRDPHPIYARLREEAPVYYVEAYDAWAISRFEDIWKCSMDAEHFSAAQGTTSSQLLTKVQPVTPMINVMDPPQHTQLRSALRGYFTPANVRKLEPLVRQLAGDCLDAARERGEIDVMGDFASQVAVKIACTINGFPLEDGDLLNDLVWRFFKREPGVDGMTEDGLAAMNELFGYFMGLIAKRRQQSDVDDVVKMLTEVEIDGKKLDDASIASHLSMLIIGGAETFPKVFATAIQRLGEYPDQRAQLAADPGLVPDAFLEMLRYDMPTQFLCRVVTKELTLHGQTLKPGQPVLYLYPSGNRDHREFENPDTFDIHRNAPRILSFGHGVHACIGQHFAKMEGKLCIQKLLDIAPEYEVKVDELQLMKTEFVQGWETMPLILNR
ncbi:MAG: cytochrome P450 [Proteobacteria bacterium]|nr:cytochrome P450 [Pseudomonadota bacterium]